MKRFILAVAILLPFGTMGIVLRTLVVEPEHPSRLSAIPMVLGNWRGSDLPIDGATAAALQATETLLRSYVHPSGERIGLFIAYFRDQKYGSQIHSPRHCLPGDG
jgi:hypothetical protein